MKQTQPTHTAIAAAVLATASLVSFNAMAAKPGAAERAEIQQTYRAERSACIDGSSTQERSACLAEAAAVRKEALNGELGLQRVDTLALAPNGDDLMANALSRCDAVPTDVRMDCERRVIGGEAVIVVGSVAEGGLITELVEQTPQSPQLAQSTQADDEVIIVAMAEGSLGQPGSNVMPVAEAEVDPSQEGLARGTTLYYGPVTQDGEQSRMTEYSAIDQSAEPMPAAMTAQATGLSTDTPYEEGTQPPSIIVAEPTEPLMEAAPEPVSTSTVADQAPVSAFPEPTPQGSAFEPGPTESLSSSWMIQQRFE